MDDSLELLEPDFNSDDIEDASSTFSGGFARRISSLKVDRTFVKKVTRFIVDFFKTHSTTSFIKLIEPKEMYMGREIEFEYKKQTNRNQLMVVFVFLILFFAQTTIYTFSEFSTEIINTHGGSVQMNVTHNKLVQNIIEAVAYWVFQGGLYTFFMILLFSFRNYPLMVEIILALLTIVNIIVGFVSAFVSGTINFLISLMLVTQMVFTTIEWSIQMIIFFISFFVFTCLEYTRQEGILYFIGDCLELFLILHFTMEILFFGKMANRRIFAVQFMVKEKNRKLKIQIEQSKILLKNMLPKNVHSKIVEAENNGKFFFTEIEKQAVVFVKIVDFNVLLDSCSEYEIIEKLNQTFGKFDDIIRKNHFYRVSTIRESYLFTSGIKQSEVSKENILRRTFRVCRELLHSVAVSDIASNIFHEGLSVKIGINQGKFVVAAIGKKSNYSLDIYGDTVNVCSRLCTANSKKSTILMLKDVYDPFHEFMEKNGDQKLRDEVDIVEKKKFLKGKGEMDCVRIEFLTHEGRESKSSNNSLSRNSLESNSSRNESSLMSGSGSSSEGRSGMKNLERVIALMKEKESKINSSKVDLSEIVENGNNKRLEEFTKEKHKLIERLGLKEVDEEFYQKTKSEYLKNSRKQKKESKGKDGVDNNNLNNGKKGNNKIFGKMEEEKHFMSEKLFKKYYNPFLVKFTDHEMNKVFFQMFYYKVYAGKNRVISFFSFEIILFSLVYNLLRFYHLDSSFLFMDIGWLFLTFSISFVILFVLSIPTWLKYYKTNFWGNLIATQSHITGLMASFFISAFFYGNGDSDQNYNLFLFTLITCVICSFQGQHVFIMEYNLLFLFVAFFLVNFFPLNDQIGNNETAVRSIVNSIQEAVSTIMMAIVSSVNAYTRQINTMREFFSDLLRTARGEKLIEVEERSKQILNSLLPPEVIQKLLKQGDKINKIADFYESVSICCTDIHDFTKLSSQRSAVEVVELINTVFCGFDKILNSFGLTRAKIIGDAYVFVIKSINHQNNLAMCVLDLLKFVENELDVQVRFGVHEGSCVGGIVGHTRFNYDYYGRSIVICEEYERTGKENRIHVSKKFANSYGHRNQTEYKFVKREDGVVIDEIRVISYWMVKNNSKIRKDCTVVED